MRNSRTKGAALGGSEGREVVANALAGALVLADLSDSGDRAAFLIEVERARTWAGESGDEVASALVHEVEDALAAIGSGESTAADGAELIGALIAAMLEAPGGPSAPSGPAAASADVDRAPTLSVQDNPYAQDVVVVSEFVSGAREQLDEAEAILSACAVGQEPDVDALFRCFHTLKGVAGFLSHDAMSATAHGVETVLEKVRSSERTLDEAVVEIALNGIDEMRTMVAEVDSQRADRARRAGAARRRGAETVRVDASRLEGLLDAMGELAVAQAEVAVAVRRTADDAALRSLERLERIAREMQATATSLRMVGLDSTFRKMGRVVRDMLASSGKKVEFIVEGGDTELDRAIVEGISDPIVHLLRNAIDHGIESPQARRGAGKPEAGRVELKAFHRSGSVHIEISDDGRGIDPGKLAERAKRLGLEFDPTRVMDLIFHPGFSTAESVTEISGRGVGMDAVFTAVTAMRGQLDVRSVPGAGTTFSIRLPLTLAVIDGIVVRAGTERFIIPTHFVDRTLSVTDDDIVSMAGRGSSVVLPGGPMGVVAITEPLGGHLDTGSVAVVLDEGDEQFAVLVDEVIGQQSLVIKPLSGPAERVAGAAGAALMGDGRVALVVDPAGIAKAMRMGR